MIRTLLFLTAVALAQGAQRSLTIPHPDCPANGHYLLPHEFDCTKFYYCNRGERFVNPTDCPENTEFSVTLQVCTHIGTSGCTLPGTPPPNEPTEFTEDDQAPESIELLDNGCPADVHVYKLLPHETSCRKFYYCVHGQKVVTTCGVGTVFNPDIQVCDHPYNVDRTCEDDETEEDQNVSSVEDSTNVSDENDSNDDNNISSSQEDDNISSSENNDSVSQEDENDSVSSEETIESSNESDDTNNSNENDSSSDDNNDAISSEENDSVNSAEENDSNNISDESDQNNDATSEENNSSHSTEENDSNDSSDDNASSIENDDGSGSNENDDGSGSNENDDGSGSNENDDSSSSNENNDGSGSNENDDGSGSNENDDGSGSNENDDSSDSNENDGGSDSNENDDGSNEDDDDEELEILPNGCPIEWSIGKYLPHEYYCSKSYQCVYGSIEEKACPVGTHFSYEVYVDVSVKKKKPFATLKICVTC